MMQPFKGEEVGSTVFITTDWCWESPQECIETRIIESDIKTIVLLTDGMEAYSFLCYVKNEKEMYSDPNLPYKPFLDSNIRAIDSMMSSGFNIIKITKMWKEYLSSGKGMENEYDDKTMLIAIYH
jgi:methyl coenzyme M reductase gamma subunit